MNPVACNITLSDSPLLMMGLPSGMEWVILGLLALLLFGRRLPGVARSIGQAIVEFKKGVKGIKDEVEEASERKIQPKDEAPSRTIDAEVQRNDETVAANGSESRPVREKSESST